MPSPSPIRTTLATIQPFILARLIAYTELNARTCFASQVDVMSFDAMGSQYVWLRWEDDRPDDGVYVGGERYDFREGQLFAVTIRTRCAIDQANRDGAWLTDTTKGHLILMHNVMDALVGFQPVDDDDNILTVAPISASKGARPRKDKQSAEWGESVRYFYFEYQLDLTLDD